MAVTGIAIQGVREQHDISLMHMGVRTTSGSIGSKI